MLGRNRSLDYGRGFLHYGCPLETESKPRHQNRTRSDHREGRAVEARLRMEW
jgi:hypothetical protein